MTDNHGAGKKTPHGRFDRFKPMDYQYCFNKNDRGTARFVPHRSRYSRTVFRQPTAPKRNPVNAWDYNSITRKFCFPFRDDSSARDPNGSNTTTERLPQRSTGHSGEEPDGQVERIESLLNTMASKPIRWFQAPVRERYFIGLSFPTSFPGGRGLDKGSPGLPLGSQGKQPNAVWSDAVGIVPSKIFMRLRRPEGHQKLRSGLAFNIIFRFHDPSSDAFLDPATNLRLLLPAFVFSDFYLAGLRPGS